MHSSILTYHSLDSSDSVISIAPDNFAAQMKALKAGVRPVVPLEQVRNIPGSVAITFDDGFENFRRYALPVLKEHALPATVFVVSGYTGKRNTWQQPPGIPEEPLMSWEGIRECSDAGISIGCHTVSHPRLPSVTADAAEVEMRESKDAIEQKTGQTVSTFAYPYGAVDKMSRDCAARHFAIACGTELAFLRASHDSFCLPRLDVYYLRDLRRFTSFSAGSGSLYISARAALRAAASVVRPS